MQATINFPCNKCTLLFLSLPHQNFTLICEGVGRNPDEVLRLLAAYQHAAEFGEVQFFFA
jgi:hypothetical protein